MKKIISIIAIVLVICMLAACNNPVKPNEDTTAGNTTEATTVAPTVTTEEPTTEVTEAPATETTEEITEETEERPSVENCTHNYQQAKAELLVEGGSCADGVRITYECSICGDSWGYSYYNTHIVGTQELVALGDGNVCDSHKAVVNECLCGVQKYFEVSDLSYTIEYEPEDVECDELVVYDACLDCGLSVIVEKDLIEVNGCECLYNAVIVINVIDETVNETEVVIRELSHNAEVVMNELNSGSDSCEDGVNVIYRCVDCGETWQEMKYEHTGADEKVDLSDYESICKDHFIRTGECACGDVLCVESDVMQWSYTVAIENNETVYYVASCPYCSLTVKRYDLETEGASRYEFFYGEEKIGEYSNNVSAQ